MGIRLQHVWRYRWKVAAVALALVCMPGRPVQADTLVGDPHAMSGFDGTVPMTGAKHGYSLVASVDYAVYAPGSFDLSFPGDDLGDNGSYVYAYQLFNSGTSNVSIATFSVGLNPAAEVANQEQLADPISPAGDPSQPPGFTSSDPTSAVWYFNGLNGSVTVNPGDKSEILIFTSPYAPTWASTAMMASHSLSAQTPSSGTPGQGNGIPSPIPEPSTMLLLVGAALGLLGFARWQKRAI
jgi:hypothetical protein